MSLAYSHIAAPGSAEEWDLVGHLEEFFRRRRLVSPGDRLLVAVSGGVDSTALLSAAFPMALLISSFQSAPQSPTRAVFEWSSS